MLNPEGLHHMEMSQNPSQLREHPANETPQERMLDLKKWGFPGKLKVEGDQVLAEALFSDHWGPI